MFDKRSWRVDAIPSLFGHAQTQITVGMVKICSLLVGIADVAKGIAKVQAVIDKHTPHRQSNHIVLLLTPIAPVEGDGADFFACIEAISKVLPLVIAPEITRQSSPEHATIFLRDLKTEVHEVTPRASFDFRAHPVAPIVLQDQNNVLLPGQPVQTPVT